MSYRVVKDDIAHLQNSASKQGVSAQGASRASAGIVLNNSLVVRKGSVYALKGHPDSPLASFRQPR